MFKIIHIFYVLIYSCIDKHINILIDATISNPGV